MPRRASRAARDRHRDQDRRCPCLDAALIDRRRADQLGALAHAEQADRLTGSSSTVAEMPRPLSWIVTAIARGVCRIVSADGAGVGVPHHVGQRFLHDPEDRGRSAAGVIRRFAGVPLDAAAQPRARATAPRPRARSPPRGRDDRAPAGAASTPCRRTVSVATSMLPTIDCMRSIRSGVSSSGIRSRTVRVRSDFMLVSALTELVVQLPRQMRALFFAR